ncbi:bud neck involved protein [Purpureocillium lilacinum]|uniref:bud neck involved protein n=1 Tax=Purpureocillium lilacinum TaxID=33203 RepID=UPI002082986B|nr:bud neck involved protein [Purpureocillium lilacinum]
MPAGQQHANHQYMGSSSQAPRSAYQGSAAAAYRGNTAPVQPYAFTSTPNLNQNMQNMQWQQYGAYRTHSSPAVPGIQTPDMNASYRPPLLSSPMAVNMGGQPHSFGIGQSGSRDDSALRSSSTLARPQSFLSVNTQPSFGSGTSNRSTSDRYRRPSGGATHHARSQSSTLPGTITMVNNATPLYSAQRSPNHAQSMSLPSGKGLVSVSSMDDMHHYSRQAQEEAKRVRRRSMHAMESPEYHKPGPNPTPARPSERGLRPQRPGSSTAHSRKASSESTSSSRSNHSRTSSVTNRNVSAPAGNPSLLASDETSTKVDQPKMVAPPQRGSSSDAAKRTINPSPLSKPATMATESAEEPSHAVAPGSAGSKTDSPAAKQLAAINQKGVKAKSKTSRLRRAFSFGSAADFRKAAAGDEGEGTDKNEQAKLGKESPSDETYDAEQARIAEAQEAGGIGNSIYGSRFFGSTDNLSISSTASSASIMIRKMGRGMKKSTRSLVGLFRPKSVIGVPAAEAVPPEASQATVSMITVEAETQRVNVTADPAAGNGGTGFPHLERNSLDAAQVPEMSERSGSSGTDRSGPRKSIVGGDRERAEVLATVRKGILKRSGSPSVRQADASPDLVLPNIPNVADSPISSAPSTPNDETQGHRRTGSIAIGNEDYFMSALRLRQDAKSPPGTPQGGKRNATFSPRIVFYDTWPSQEYDRRGEIATCNRLTPMLAQQIKEELNTFKMEMEVHENSKIYTHFF